MKDTVKATAELWIRPGVGHVKSGIQSNQGHAGSQPRQKLRFPVRMLTAQCTSRPCHQYGQRNGSSRSEATFGNLVSIAPQIPIVPRSTFVGRMLCGVPSSIISIFATPENVVQYSNLLPA